MEVKLKLLGTFCDIFILLTMRSFIICTHPQISLDLIYYNGVRICLRTAATNGPIVHPPGDM
jgi:hypothetical protein